MAQTNAELLRRAVEFSNVGDVESALDVLDPELELHTPFSSVTGEPYRGIPGYRKWRAEITDQFEKWETNIDEIRALSDDRLIGVGSVHARGRGSGIEFDQPAAGLVDFREGRVLRVRIYLSEEQALQAAALPERADSSRPGAGGSTPAER
jgi:ketosteroid isomerase-like protein